MKGKITEWATDAKMKILFCQPLRKTTVLKPIIH